MLPLSLPGFDDLRDGHIKSPCSAFFLSTNVFDNGSNKEFGVKMFLIEVSRGGPNLFFIIFLFQACLICSKSNQCLLNATQVL